MEALGSQMEALSRSTPVLMIFEDAHWADPTSLEVVSRVVNRLRNLRVLLIVTFRPEFDPPWIGRPYVTALTLNRLAQRDIETVIDNVIGNKPIPAGIRQDIIERADGIPLFVEEMTKAVLEAGNEGAAQQTVASFPSPALAVPASLQASLMARLDRLGAAKELAQVGAAIGREFSHALLSAVVSKPEPALVLALDRLIAAGLLFRQGVPPHSSYLFNHALVQDAAYGTLLREPRRGLHARIAETLEVQFPEIAENQPELLARHCTEAGLIEKAAGFWGNAGQRSLERSALVEAIALFTRALDQIATLPITPALRREQIKLQVALIVPLRPVKGHAAPETKAAIERAHVLIEQAKALGEPPEDPLLLFSVLYGFWFANFVAFNGNTARELAAQFLTLAEKQGATVPLIVGHRITGASLMYTGNIAESRAHYDQSLALYRPDENRSLTTRFGLDGEAAVLTFRSLALWFLGYPEAARADMDHALENARRMKHAPTLMSALMWAGILSSLYFRDQTEANAQAEELIALAEEKGSLFLKAHGKIIQGAASALTGKAADAVEVLTSAITAWRATGATVVVAWPSCLARAYAELGQLDDAWRCMGEVMTTMEATKERWWEAEVYRMAGEIALKSPQPETAKAETYFQSALAVARQQQAKSWELRALARSGQAAGSLRTPCSGLRLVHRRV